MTFANIFNQYICIQRISNWENATKSARPDGNFESLPDSVYFAVVSFSNKFQSVANIRLYFIID